MDRIKKTKLAFITTAFSFMLIGMLLGAVMFNAFLSSKIDAYMEEIDFLKTVIEDRDIRLKKLEDSINSRKYILRNIEVSLIIEEDEEIDKIALEKSIKEKYSKLIGKEIKEIDIEMLADIVDKRIMRIDGHEYQLNVQRIMLSDVLKLWIMVKKLEE